MILRPPVWSSRVQSRLGASSFSGLQLENFEESGIETCVKDDLTISFPPEALLFHVPASLLHRKDALSKAFEFRRPTISMKVLTQDKSSE